LPDDIATPIILTTIGAVIGLAAKAFYDKLAMPTLKIETETYPVLLPDFPLDPSSVGSPPPPHLKVYESLLAYRVRIRNKQKKLLDSAAENCIAWLELDQTKEPLQISWVGGHADVIINVGDYRELDFCALATSHGIVFAPTEIGYSDRPRRIGRVGTSIHGTLRVTSSNGKRAERRFMIDTGGSQGGLRIEFE